MSESPFISIAGNGSTISADAEFDRGETVGMRSAAAILLASAVIGLLSWAALGDGLPTAAAIDAFLGAQLLRLRHSWRAWVMLRAGIGVVAGLAATGFGLFGDAGIANGLLGAGIVSYSVALLLMLAGTPTARRVFLGWAVFVLSTILSALAIVLGILRQAGANESTLALLT